MEIRQILLTFWPLIAFQILLAIAALVSIARRGEPKKFSKLIWVIIVLGINLFGPILYFMIGKGELKNGDVYRD
jgi:hypothetical protein